MQSIFRMEREPAMFKVSFAPGRLFRIVNRLRRLPPELGRCRHYSLGARVNLRWFGAIGPDRPWLWALAVGAWIPIYEIPSTRNYGSLLALVMAFVGAYAGTGLRKLLGGFKSAQQSP
jgi:hypothetical protein